MRSIPAPIVNEHLDYTISVWRTIWESGWKKLRKPTLTVHRYVAEDADPSAGYKGTEVDTENSVHNCVFGDYKEFLVANSDGLIQRRDQKVIIWDFEPERTDILEMPSGSGNLWAVVEKEYREGRCILQLRPHERGD